MNLIKLFLLLTLMLSTLGAQIIWDFNYTDAAGVGFNDSALGATRKASLQSTANILSGWLNHTATIKVDIQSNNSSSAGYLAYASTSGTTANGFNKNVLQTKIQTNGSTDLNGATKDATINVNFFYSWGYSDSIGSSEFDFKGVLLHELTHTLGFVSLIDSAGRGLNDNSSGSPDCFSDFDRFLTDAFGNPLVNPTTFAFNTSEFSDLTGNPGMFFNGANAVAAYGGLVPLYSPSTWEEGSSGSHLNDSSFSPDAMMEHATGPGLGVRNWNGVERGILTDIGYSLTAIPEPGSYLLICCGAVLFFVFHRKKKLTS